MRQKRSSRRGALKQAQTIARVAQTLPLMYSTRLDGSFCGLARWLHEVIEYFTLHAFDLGPVSAGDKSQLLRATANTQSRQQIKKIGNSLACHFQFLIVLNHVLTLQVCTRLV